jgi:hypothetical protein
MQDVYLLWHVDDRPDKTDSKLLGVFSTEEKARAWQQEASELPGFRDAPERFLVDRQRLDEPLWEDGFAAAGD